MQSGQNRTDDTEKDEILAAAEAGIDIDMLEANLKRSPIERIKRHQIAFNTAEKLRKAKRL
ncbi:MAG: hypothetical protein KAQ89_04495 [Planctomycetes bacterium]|nr:hypothetical protein [Planctomycetota bacterium]